MIEPQLTPQVIALLEVMLRDPTDPWHGFELCKEAGLKSGTVYPALARLERAGWLDSEWEDVDPSLAGRPRRRLYRLSGTGEAAARGALDRLMQQVQRARLAGRNAPRLGEEPA
jgi:PadR family transcriptional regulator, regulatory protein PadR